MEEQRRASGETYLYSVCGSDGQMSGYAGDLNGSMQR